MGGSGSHSPLLDDLLINAAAAAVSGSHSSNPLQRAPPASASSHPLSHPPPPLDSSPGVAQSQSPPFDTWNPALNSLQLPSPYSSWYGAPMAEMGFTSGADLLGGSIPGYDDYLTATINPPGIGSAASPVANIASASSSDDSLLSQTAFYGSEGSVPSASSSNSSLPRPYHSTQHGMDAAGIPTSAPFSRFQSGHHPVSLSNNAPESPASAYNTRKPVSYHHRHTSPVSNAPSGPFPPATSAGASSDAAAFGVDRSFTDAALPDGRSLYTEALNRWDLYSPFHTDVFQSLPDQDVMTSPQGESPVSPWGKSSSYSPHDLPHPAPRPAASPSDPAELMRSPPSPIPTPPARSVLRERGQGQGDQPQQQQQRNVSEQSVQNFADQLLQGENIIHRRHASG